jgi:hypothetical protein
MTQCEFRKRGPRGIDLCTVNNLVCLVDDGYPVECLRYAWVKQVRQKTSRIEQLSAELVKLCQYQQSPLFPELPDGEAIAPWPDRKCAPITRALFGQEEAI